LLSKIISTDESGFLNNLKPDFFINSIYDIDAHWLAYRNIRALIIDVDNTIMARNDGSPGCKLKNWVTHLRDSGIELLMVSNNWTERVRRIADDLNLRLLAPAGKPLGQAFKRAIAVFEAKIEETAILGDQLFTDILGGNRAGILTVIVPPTGEVELIHTRFLRVFEKALLHRLSGKILVDGKWRATITSPEDTHQQEPEEGK